MHSDTWPKTRRAKYLLLLLGLVPFGEILYVAGPKVLLPIGVGVLGALAVGLKILGRVERIIALDQSNVPRQGRESNAVTGSITDRRHRDGAA
jgi:hypothetical protein